MEEIQAACQRLQAGDWTREELEVFIETMLGKLRGQREAIAGYAAETGYLGAQEVEVGLVGARKFEEGLERILNSSIEEGLELVSQGDEMIRQAMEINRQERQRLEEG